MSLEERFAKQMLNSIAESVAANTVDTPAFKTSACVYAFIRFVMLCIDSKQDEIECVKTAWIKPFKIKQIRDIFIELATAEYDNLKTCYDDEKDDNIKQLKCNSYKYGYLRFLNSDSNKSQVEKDAETKRLKTEYSKYLKGENKNLFIEYATQVVTAFSTKPLFLNKSIE